MAGRIQSCPEANMLQGTISSSPAMATDYPVTWLQDRWHPLRAMRSTNLNLQTIDLDLGASKSIYAVGLQHFNFDQVEIKYGTGSPAATHFTGSPLSTPASLKKDRDGVRKHLLIQTVTARYLRIVIPNHTPTSGESYFFLGCLFVAGAWNTLSNNPDDPINYRLLGAYQRNRKNNRHEKVRTGNNSLRIAWRSSALDATGEAEWRALELLGEDAPVLLYNNEDKAEEMYWVRSEEPQDMADYTTHKQRTLTWETLA